MVKTLVQIVRCKHALGALLIHTDWKLARQKGQPSVPGAGEDGAICLFVKRLLSFYEKWEMWAVWLSQLLLPQPRDAFLLWPSAAQILVPLWYLCLACSSQPLIYIPYEFQRFGGSASRSCRTEGFQNTLPIWKPRAALGIFCVQTTWKARFLGPFIWVIYHIFKLQTDAPLSRLQLLTRPQITQSCTFNCKITKSTTLKKKEKQIQQSRDDNEALSGMRWCIPIFWQDASWRASSDEGPVSQPERLHSWFKNRNLLQDMQGYG